MQKVTVRVPASTSNLGPGFDCLGVALRIYNYVTLTHGGKSRDSRIVNESVKLFFKRLDSRPFPLSCSFTENIPRSRGLGSSATIRLGVLQALNQLAGNPFDRLSIFHLCTQLEGHPDNAAPASFGGFTVVGSARCTDRTPRRGVPTVKRDSYSGVQRFEVSPRLHFILLVPDLKVPTMAARRILPLKISRVAAVESCANACSITAAFVSRKYEKLRGSFGDQLHQPFRRKLNPFLPRVIAAAENAGALGAFLSGSGSTICAVALQDRQEVAAAMLRAAGSASARVIITTADNLGAQTRNSKFEIRN
jgi:homoserine kinase